MEVHAHSHTERKKFIHYLWEFFMLFLAVTLGFLVENMREHLMDQKKERSYIQSLLSDLKKDTTIIGVVTKAHFKLIRGEDSLIDALNNYRDIDSINRRCYRYYFRYATACPKVVFNERTMSQLLNSGNMRLIHKQSVSDSIMDYNSVVKYVQDQGNAYEEYFKKALDFSENIFDFGYTQNTLTNDYTVKPKLQLAKTNFILLSKDPAIFKKYTNDMSLLIGVLETYMFAVKNAKEKATQLIAFLQKEYHLE
jgi:hypothetical protein